MRKVFLAVLLLLLAGTLSGQQTMNNDSVIKLIQAGLSEDLIISTINASPGNYDISVDGLVSLKGAGVSEKVLSAIITRSSGGGSATVSPASNVATNPNAQTGGLPPGVDTVGVYYKDQTGMWQEVNTEVVNFKTGGTLKNMGSLGVVKKDLNGKLKGTQSRLALRIPVEFLFYLPEGQSPGEYQLLRMRVNKNEREFRSVTGGVFNTSSGADRDMIDYTPMKFAPRVYTIMLDRSVNAGEYGFLPPVDINSKGSIASSGRMFTFTLIP